MLWAGTDGGGVVYRIDPRVAGAKPFAMLAATQREITALAEDEAVQCVCVGRGFEVRNFASSSPCHGRCWRHYYIRTAGISQCGERTARQFLMEARCTRSRRMEHLRVWSR